LNVPFRLTKEGAGSKIARAAGLANDATIGDEAFDSAWTIDADPGLARAVLDPSIRARLMELRSRVGEVSQDFGPGTMSVILTQHGLALRWPGDINVAFATYIRDLLLAMRERILAHVDREAARGGAQAGYRVGADAGEALPPSEEEVDSPAQRERA